MKKFLAVLSLAVLLLSACNLFEKGKTEPESTEINSVTVLDNEAYKWATSDKNVELCANISNTAKKDECIKVVDALILTDKAIAELDENICREIEIESYEKNCKDVTESKLEQQEADSKKVKELEKANEEATEIEGKAMAEDNEDICNDIKDENQKYSCRFNILANRALLEKNVKICEKIGDKEFAKTCVETVEGL